MITKNEINTLNLSPINKDFVQIWNELLEIASKLSERWDPVSTNESDPGIVLLKVLTGLADKLNYNIDKNTLEAFMPTAAQEDSMRKLCEMLGYNIKYYQSAQTDVTIKYHSTDSYDDNEEETIRANDQDLVIPKFTVITNSDQDISYFTLNAEPYRIRNAVGNAQTIHCMEGQVVKCETVDGNNIVTAAQISDNNRFYLPEVQIAENGIFVYNVFASGNALLDGTEWTKVDNLNVQARSSRVFKFGYDSYEGRPYLEFPEDYTELINDGLFIYYTRTKGVDGNISVGTLTQMELPSTGAWEKISPESFSVTNYFAATTGKNIETIEQAYNNFKKTIGTFETLITCRDYMNKIYSMADRNGKPLVSNALVTDIRNDINHAITICSCDDAGILYKEKALSSKIPVTISNIECTATKPRFIETETGGFWCFGDGNTKLGNKRSYIQSDNLSSFSTTTGGKVSLSEDGYWIIEQNNQVFKTNLRGLLEYKATSAQDELNHFDIILYPFKTFNTIKSGVKNIKTSYDSSFEYTNLAAKTIKQQFDPSYNEESLKTIAHNILDPKTTSENTGSVKNFGDILSINNYLRLDATIATNSKVTAEESVLLTEKIKIALANAFNMRELDFGEEIPFDRIIQVIEKADSRIRIASLNNPALYTTFSVLDSIDTITGRPVIKEYAVASDSWLSKEIAKEQTNIEVVDNSETDPENGTFDTKTARKIYNYLALRNLLAGRVALFNYDTTFSTGFSERSYYVETEEVFEPATKPDEEHPLVIYTKDKTLYISRYNSKDPDNPDNKAYKIKYDLKDNVKSGNETNDITNLRTNLDINLDPLNSPENKVTLAEGEYVKFRAPNLVTTTTYPAYVNYHLTLQKPQSRAASAANADTLFNLLNADSSNWTAKTPNIAWQKVLDYFTTLDSRSQSTDKLVKTFTVSQDISKFTVAKDVEGGDCPSNAEGHEKGADGKCIYCGKTLIEQVKKGPIVIKVNTQEPVTGPDIDQFLAESGCIKLTNQLSNGAFKVRVEWAPADGERVPSKAPGINIELTGINSPFITDSATVNQILTTISEQIDLLKGAVKEGTNTPVLPTECSWRVCLDFACVPFTVSSLSAWESFVGSPVATDIFGFTPATANNTILWRTLQGGYPVGRFIQSNGDKLLAFGRTYFSSLPDSRLSGLYIARTLGSDAAVTVIENETDYRLKDGEYLYIEYTPSSTTEDGAAQEAVTEILGPGKIIRPSGFEGGLVDSTVYDSSPVKTVEFINTSGARVDIDMYRLGASEQIEVRELARVKLDSESFNGTVYIYKNFDNSILEEGSNTAGERKYILKNGEYIFYTDRDKTEMGIFTTGTEIILSNKATIPKAEVIDLATIWENGIKEIPWSRLNLPEGQTLTFQEYQYITLGPGDTLNELTVDHTENKLTTQDWKTCVNGANYTLAAAESATSLPTIDIEGYSWEANSILALDVSSTRGQTIRSTDFISSTLILESPDTKSGEATKISEPLELKDGATLTFKTNLPCQTATSEINISEVMVNPENLRNFKIKAYKQDQPCLVRTQKSSVLPKDPDKDWLNWEGVPISAKATSDLWSTVGIGKDETGILATNDYDNALRLPINLIPNTYGIFCIYLNYPTQTTKNTTWLEMLPDETVTAKDLFKLLNYPESEQEYCYNSKNQAYGLILKPGINCIRVNQPGYLFVKASADTQGILYFDDIQMIKTEEVKYTLGEDKVEHVVYTDGLNLSQLGYLEIPDTVDTISTELYEKLKADRIAEAREEIVGKKAQTTEAAIDDLKKLQEVQDKLKFLAEQEEKIVTDIESFKKKYCLSTVEAPAEETTKDLPESFASLFKDIFTIKDQLAAKQKLVEALEENTNIDELEQELIQVLSELATIENLQKDFIQQLNDIKNTIDFNIVNLTDTEILNNLKAAQATISSLVGGANPQATYRAAIADKATILVEADFNAKLQAFTEEFNAVGNSQIRSSLNEAIKALHNKTINEDREELATEINRILKLLDTEEMVSKFNTLYDAASDYDFVSVLSGLNEILLQLDNPDSKFIISELSTLAETASDTYLQKLVENLNSTDGILAFPMLLAAITATPISYSWQENTTTKNETAKSLLELVQDLATNLLDDPSVKQIAQIAAVKGQIQTLSKTYQDEFKSGVSKQKDVLSNILSALMSDTGDDYNQVLMKLLNNLSKNEQSQVEELIKRLEDIVTQRNTDISTWKTFRNTTPTWPDLDEDIFTLNYGQPAAVSSWKAFYLAKLADKVTSLYNDLYVGFSGTIALDKVASFIADDYIKYDTFIINNVVMKATLENLEDNFNSAIKQNTKSTGIGEQVQAYDTHIPLIKAIKAWGSQADLSKDKTAVLLLEFYNSLVNTEEPKSIHEKQQLMQKLAVELQNSINVDNNVLKALTRVCPSLLYDLRASLTEFNDPFFVALTTELDTWEAGLQDALATKEGTVEAAIIKVLDTISETLACYNPGKKETTGALDFDKRLSDILGKSSNEQFSEVFNWAKEPTPGHTEADIKDKSLAPNSVQEVLNRILNDSCLILVDIDNTLAKDLTAEKLYTKTAENPDRFGMDEFIDSLKTNELNSFLHNLAVDIYDLKTHSMQTDTLEKLTVLDLERQLYKDIWAIDVDHDFYYNIPVENSVAIQFAESDSRLNTLMNPQLNYDINNINNNFVISKLDIDYLSKGLQVARSSRIN